MSEHSLQITCLTYGHKSVLEMCNYITYYSILCIKCIILKIGEIDIHQKLVVGLFVMRQNVIRAKKLRL